ncbi:alpha/beta fold hydrolase [Labilibaculum sp.]|uniref:alpha/beta fold hydrolase n=1 Tax=Labilibaculum sp. TaxID=2060723 RepID=UPI0035642071
MKLSFKKLGKGPALIIVHGLYGSSDNWLTIAKELSNNFEVFIIDQRNHGNSPHASTHSYLDLKEDLLEFMNDQHIEKAILIGHSMGGKTVMFFALDYPERVNSLLVVDIAPKNYSKISDYAPQTIDHSSIVKAMQNFDLSPYKNRTDIDRKLAETITDKRIRQFLLKNLKRDENKQFIWKLNIKIISEYLSEIMDGIEEDQYKDRKGNSSFPVLFIKGAKSNYISDDDHNIIRSFFPRAEITTIPNAGHWVHSEQAKLLIKTIEYFVLD